MADFIRRTYYFKLTGKKVWYFKVDRFDFDEKTDCLFLTYLPKDLSLPLTKVLLEKFIQTQMTEYGLKYEELNEDEIERLKLLYEK